MMVIKRDAKHNVCDVQSDVNSNSDKMTHDFYEQLRASSFCSNPRKTKKSKRNTQQHTKRFDIIVDKIVIYVVAFLLCVDFFAQHSFVDRVFDEMIHFVCLNSVINNKQ